MARDIPITPDRLRDDVLHHLTYSLGKDGASASLQDWRMALSLAVRDRMVDAWFASTKATYKAGAKRVYYLSMEYLIGRLLQDAIINLGLMDKVDTALTELGLNTSAVLADEPDAALGNGGLGRLAACFLESLSTMGVPAMGYGIRYEHGLFRQSFDHGRQVESPETWLLQPHAWEFQRAESRYPIGVAGHVEDQGGRAVWHPAETVVAEAYDTPMIGWKGRWANTLRLWAAKPVQPFDLQRFNAGDYAAAAEPEAFARTISRVLYPDDTTDEGKKLRLKQEFFFTAASLRDILRRFDSEHDDIRKLPTKVAIQLNDTHPAIAGPELVRILHDERGLDFDEAETIARACLSYTNHTLLPEALESWSEGLMGYLLPRHLQIIDRIDHRHARANPSRRTSSREHGQAQMGMVSFMMAHRVNGVSALHTELMKSTVFRELDGLHPDRIVNQTNGVTPRRWLLGCNPALSHVISNTIGTGWEDDLDRLKELEAHVDDADFMSGFVAAKHTNKQALARFVAETEGVHLDPAAMFDIQIKRIHEYKRQHLNILEAIALWQDIRETPEAPWTPRVKIFAGKAAPGYAFAKDIIRLINDVARVINSDPVTSRYLKVVFLPNYNVTLAEKLIPAADLSEQISTAGKEASGTGNMKFALNGALTVGTLDGANVEIRDHVGADNFLLFGMTAEEAVARRQVAGHAGQAIAADARLARALGALRDGTFGNGETHRYHHIADNIAGPDYFLVASDFADYWRAQREADALYADPAQWHRKAALNTARSGWFSSDRTIRGYMADIWQTQSLLS